MSYTLQGAVNLTKDRKGGYKKAAEEVFKKWGFATPHITLVGETDLVNDIGAKLDDTLLAAVVRECLAERYRWIHWTKPHKRKVPAVRRPEPQQVEMKPFPKIGQRELDL